MDERWTSRRALRAAPLLVVLTGGGAPLFAQPPSPTLARPIAPAHVSATGVVALGFAPYLETSTLLPIEFAGMLPQGSDIPVHCRPLLEDMWRGSATFRRQWIRVAAARVQVAITLDTSPSDRTSAHSEISRRAGLRVRISLRIVDRDAIALLAHEIEHVLEQLDDVDLAGALAAKVHGASATGRSPAFETRRAVVVGRVVAGEVAAYRDRR